MKKFLMASAAALASLALCATAAWAVTLPTFKSDLIVPNRSLAGVPIRSTYKEAVRAFSSGARGCSTTKGCVFRASNGATFSIIFARLSANSKPIAAEISILTGESSSGKPLFSGPLTALKTSSGIGIGSSASAVKRAYPHATGSARKGQYVVQGSTKVQSTRFTIDDGRVSGISMVGVALG
jgi:hypothetical protein